MGQNSVSHSSTKWTASAGFLAVGLCLMTLAATSWVSSNVFECLPHTEDELAFLFQARTISSGRIVADAPPIPDFFSVPFIIVREGLWFGKYPPGYPAVLALGVLVGQPWLVNPLFAALSVGLVYVVGRRLYGELTGLVATALAASSPFLLLQAGSFMSHVVGLFWALLSLLLFATAQRRSSLLASLGAGIALGALFISRPLTAAGIGMPYVLWVGIDIIRAQRHLRTYLPMLLGFLPLVIAWLAYNHLTTGHPLSSAYELWWPYDRIGFGEGIGHGGQHTLAKGLFNTRVNLTSLARYLFGWPGLLSFIPSVLAVVAALVHLEWQLLQRLPGQLREAKDNRRSPETGGTRDPSPALWDLVLIGMFVSLVLVHVAYWTTGEMYGPRYYFEALGALALLSARGILQSRQFISIVFRRAIPLCHDSLVWSTIGVTLIIVGLCAHSFRHFVPQKIERFTGWYGIDGDGVRVVQAAGIQQAVVFVELATWTDYAPFFSQNVPSLDSDIVYAIDLSENRNHELMALYPGRTFFKYVEGDLVPLTGD